MNLDDKESVDFGSLEGERVLDAVDMDTTQVQRWGDEFESANVIRFRLDGVVYTCVENPDDGYRSSMEKMFVSDDEMKNVFEPIRVLARVRDKYDDGYGGTADVLQLLDINSGRVILEAGTDNTDDYYPWFVAKWNPVGIDS